jgi:hypothetical protein
MVNGWSRVVFPECLSDFFLHISDLLSVAYKITQSVQEGLTYLHDISTLYFL